MIFAKTLPLVLSGRKTQTLRLAHRGDYLYDDGDVCKVVEQIRVGSKWKGRPRWIVGHTYAVQPERGRPAVGRMRVTYLREVTNPLAADAALAYVEGFDSLDEFLQVWRELHPSGPSQRSWAIGFVLVTPAEGGQTS